MEENGIVSLKQSSVEVALINAEQAIYHLKTLVEARAFIDDLKKFEQLIKAAHAANDEICKFCFIQASAYIRIANEFNGDLSSKKDNRIVAWLRTLSKAEQESILDRAKTGRSIIAEYEDSAKVQRYYEAIEDACVTQNEVIQEYIDNGIVEVHSSRFLDNMHKYNCFSNDQKNAAEAFTSSTRSKLLLRGAVCIGDGKYCNPLLTRNKKELLNAINIRVVSIAHDIFNLYEITKTFETLPSFDVSSVEESEDLRFLQRLVSFLKEQSIIN